MLRSSSGTNSARVGRFDQPGVAANEQTSIRPVPSPVSTITGD